MFKGVIQFVNPAPLKDEREGVSEQYTFDSQHYIRPWHEVSTSSNKPKGLDEDAYKLFVTTLIHDKGICISQKTIRRFFDMGLIKIIKTIE